jgi:hypothetical protein
VKSALKRARVSLQRRQSARPPAADSPRRGCDGGEVVSAWESADIDGLLALLTDDVFMSMPPLPFEYESRESWRASAPRCSARAGDSTSSDPSQRSAGVRRLPARRHRCPHGTGLYVLTLSGDRISAMTRFENSVFPAIACRDRSPRLALVDHVDLVDGRRTLADQGERRLGLGESRGEFAGCLQVVRRTPSARRRPTGSPSRPCRASVSPGTAARDGVHEGVVLGADLGASSSVVASKRCDCDERHDYRLSLELTYSERI